MESSGITPVMNVGGYGDSYGFGGNGLWLFAILALMNGGFGGWGNRGFADGRYATVEDLNNSANFTRLENQVQGIGTTQLNQFNNVTNAISTLGYETLKNFNTLGSQLADCCCTTQRAIDSVKFDMANYASAINANTTAGVQKVLDAISQNKIDSLQAQVNDLKLNNAFCGVPRINPYAYGIYQYPACGVNNCGYTNI